MQIKLTLYLDEQLLEQATVYATDHGKTLEQIIADYLSRIVADTPDVSDRSVDLPPITRSLLGVLKTSDMDMDEDDYYAYLEKKYR